MQGPDWARVQELFWAALDRPAAEREAFLEDACGGDDALRADVVSLLAADAVVGPDPLRLLALEALRSWRRAIAAK